MTNHKISSKITYLQLNWNLPGANEGLLWGYSTLQQPLQQKSAQYPNSGFPVMALGSAGLVETSLKMADILQMSF